MNLIRYEISPSTRVNYEEGIIGSKNGIPSLELNYHWPSLVKIYIRITEPELLLSLQGNLISSFWVSYQLESTLQNYILEDNDLLLEFKLDRKGGEQLLPDFAKEQLDQYFLKRRQSKKDSSIQPPERLIHYPTHLVVIGDNYFPIRSSAKRSRKVKRRVEETDVHEGLSLKQQKFTWTNPADECTLASEQTIPMEPLIETGSASDSSIETATSNDDQPSSSEPSSSDANSPESFENILSSSGLFRFCQEL
jgi:hypothetical protein